MKKFYLLGLAAAALFAGVYVQGCGGGTSDGGGAGCTSDTDCGSTGLCNTAIGQCMTKCTQGSDCSPTTTCAADHTSGPVCTCSIDSQCPSGSVCNVADQACQLKCTTDTNCQGYAQSRKCDTATGQCVPTNAGGNDGGADGGNTGACSATQPCTAGTDVYCASNDTCTTDPNHGGGQCQQVEMQDNCAYGAACFTDTNTSPLPICEFVGQCQNSGSTTVTPNESPVIYDVTETGTRTANETDANGNPACSTGTAAQFTGHFYDLQSDFTGSYSKIGRVDGNTVKSGGTTYLNTGADANSGTFTFELCTDLSGTATGVYVIDQAGNQSNVACLPSF